MYGFIPSFPTKGHPLQEPENSYVESYLGPQTLTKKKKSKQIDRATASISPEV